MGPFELMDLVGVDVGLDVVALVLRAELRRAALAPVADHRRDGRRGRAGRKCRPGLLRLPSGDGRLPPRRPRAAHPRRRGRDDRDRRRNASGTRAGAGCARRRLGRRLARRGAERGAAVPDPRSRARGGAGGTAPGQPGDLLRCRIAVGARPRRRRRRLPRPAAARREPTRRAHPWTRDAPVRRRCRGALLRNARQTHRVGRGRARTRVGADRVPAGQRELVRAGRGSRLGTGHRRGHGPRPEPSACGDEA